MSRLAGPPGSIRSALCGMSDLTVKSKRKSSSRTALGTVSGSHFAGSIARHGTTHNLEPLPSFTRFCLPARPLHRRQEGHRSGRTTAQGFVRSLLALPVARCSSRAGGSMMATTIPALDHAGKNTPNKIHDASTRWPDAPPCVVHSGRWSCAHILDLLRFRTAPTCQRE
jgi:hypothetical protein